jgi:uncharacterized protein YegP (UPF0339 family)
MLAVAKVPKHMRFEYWKSGDGNWTWQLKTSVDDVLAQGVSYASRENCLAAIKLVKLAAAAPSADVSAAAPVAHEASALVAVT